MLALFWYCDSIENIFFSDEAKNASSLYRLLWCSFGSLWGFSAIAFYWRDVKEAPFPRYLTYYPFLLLVISLLVFSVLHLFDKTSGYLFYYSSFGLCAMFGFQVDQFLNIWAAILDKAKDKI
jgi:hypothetical protein